MASACPPAMTTASNGVFQGNNPLDYSLPLVILQICIVVVLTRVLAFLLRPLRQPRVIAEIVGGILLGPSVLGRNNHYMNTIFPARSLTVLDTLANLGLLFFLFLAGLALDLSSLRRTGKKDLSIAVAGIILPFLLGIGTSFSLLATIAQDVNQAPFFVFMGVSLSVTAFPVLARILVDLKLLTTDIGRMAMSAGAVNDLAAWILLALAIALSGTSHSLLVALWVFLCGAGFIAGCMLILPPMFKWMANRCPEGQPVGEIYVCATLAAVLAAGFVTDMIGIHALFGAFVMGVMMPKEGPFADSFVEKVEDLVSGLFLPLYFVSSGLKTDITTIRGCQSWGLLVLVISTTSFGKVIGTIVVSLLCKVTFQEALALGFLMNTKGLVEIVVLNIGKDRKVLNDQTFAIMVLMAVFTTFITTPLVMAVYKPGKRASKPNYKYRTIEKIEPNAQFRLLVCFYCIRGVPTLINLIEASRGKEEGEGLRVYAMHLMELSERSSAILMVHKARKTELPFWTEGKQSNCDQQWQLSRVSVHPMTAISAIANIHEDICNSAESKRAAMIILPFHMHQRLDGGLETTRTDFRWVNKRVLENAPCSVGILVDRGLGGTTHVATCNVNSFIIVLFFGGCDDREALAYGARMAEHPGNSLNVIRFLASPDFSGDMVRVEIEEESETSSGSADEMFLAGFKNKISGNNSIAYEEKEVKNAAETVELIRGLNGYDLFLVGRMPEGQAAASLNSSSDCPELGLVGSLLTSLDFQISASVLVVQQYTRVAELLDEGSNTAS
ncbi:Na_H_Exchanger domain-containing protein [Cephalotus follicularis]|uniref:Na_H_Exchanger domain-containing protein n=1 Tax=Cephalotus follicularis TaxID=3775 RepID=A0A1Q3B693_CEPFO|nr:Na_H_Exchanger domain-containing protein [Cephalotus follicularis]